MTNKRIVILGAGPAGLSAAYFHKQRGHDVRIIEKMPFAGGLNCLIQFQEEKYDLGPHCFYGNYAPIARDLFETIIGSKNYQQTVPTRLMVSSYGTMSNPLNFSDLFHRRNYSLLVPALLHRLIRKRTQLNSGMNAANAFIGRYGKTLFNAMFRPYCLKYFGVEPETLDGYFTELLYSASPKENGNHVLIPDTGTLGTLWSKLCDKLQDQDVEIFYSHNIEKILLKENKISGIITNHSVIEDFDEVISTLPVLVLKDLLQSPAPADLRLTTRSTVFVYMEVGQVSSHALYLADYRVNSPIGRISFCNNWKANKKTGNNVICAEFWCSYLDSVWIQNDRWYLDWLRSYLDDNKVITLLEDPKFKILKVANTHPVPTMGYRELVQQQLSEFEYISNLRMTGRQVLHAWDGTNNSIMNAYDIVNG